jgi:thioredoxin-like negative regulator of GroEL
MKKYLATLAIALATLSPGAAAFAENPKAPLSTPAIRAAVAPGDRSTLLFFQNPAGAPCQAQDKVLRKLLDDRKGGFRIVAVSVARPEDQKAFYDYGVRSLPSLVLVGKDGRVHRVFPPGIQSYETVSAALDKAR